MESESCRCPLGAVRHCIARSEEYSKTGEYDKASEWLATAEKFLNDVPRNAVASLRVEIEKIRLRIADTGEWDFSDLHRE